MENLYDKVLLMKKSKLAPEQVLLENNIQIESEKEVTKILAVGSSVDVDRPIEAVLNESTVSGRIITNLVYASGDGELNSQTSVSPFTYKFNNEEICAGAKLNVNASVVNSELDKLVGNNLKVITTLNLDAVVIKNEEVEYLKDGNSDTFIKQEEKEIVTHSGFYCDKFEEKLEATVKNGVKKVLMTSVECLLKEWNLGPNFISVECELYAKVLYADNQEISELQTITISKNIKQEIEANGVNKDCDLDVFAVVLKESVLTEISENGENVGICVNVPIMICANSYEQTKILTVADIYSSKNVLSIQNDSVENCKNLKPEYLESKIEGNVVLSDDSPRIDKYLATTNVNVITSNAYVKDGSLVLEGIINANVIYLNDEMGEIQSVEIEIPYVMDKRTDLVSDVILEPIVGLFDIDVMVKRGREIYFDAKAKAFVNATCKNSYNLITKIDAVGDHEPKDGAIEIYFAKAGETIWDIAKSLKISSEIITRQNPELSDPLDKDENIALYFQKNRTN